MPEFSLSPLSSLSLRHRYLTSLAEPQEWFLETLARSGQCWMHADGTYAITHETTLVEFVSPDPALGPKRLLDFQAQQGFSSALVKSYDPELIRLFKALGWTCRVGGILFRKRRPQPPRTFEGAEIRAAVPADLGAIWQMNDDFFESPEELANLAGSDSLWTVTQDGKIAGCGLCNTVDMDRDAVDIGMLVAADFRRKGLGTYIISAIADRLEQEGLRPICGCGASNIASKATLEKAGFVSEHQLLSFKPHAPPQPHP